MNELSEYLLQFKSIKTHKIKFYDLNINDINEDKAFYEKYFVYGKLKFVKFLVLDKCETIDHVYVAPKYMSGIFWTKCTSVDELKNVLQSYNLIAKSDNMGCVTLNGFICCDYDIPIDALEKFILLHPIIEKFMWGAEYSNPTIKNYDKANSFERGLILSELCKYKNDKNVKLSATTKYSNSCISFDGSHDNVQYVTVSYIPTIKNKNIHKFNEFKGTTFSDDMPSDILSVLMTLPKFIVYADLLNGEITNNDVVLAIILATKNNKDTLDIVNKFTKLLEKRESLRHEVVVQIEDFLHTYQVNNIIDDVLSKDGILVKKIIECTNEKKLKKLISELRNKCIFDKCISERLIKGQLKYVVSKLAREFEKE